MSGVLIPLIGAVVVFIVCMLLLPKSMAHGSANRREGVLSELERERNQAYGEVVENPDEIVIHDYTMQDAISELGPTGRTLIRLPGGLNIYRLMVQAGKKEQAAITLAGAVAIALVLAYFLRNIMGLAVFIATPAIAYLFLNLYLNWVLKRRLRAFMDRFADGIDMIVRAVKAGNPVNTALRLVAEHGESPVREEFRILVDEITYGRPLVDALNRLAKRIPEYDVSFFVVVLTIQQETGGNLGEVLGKLSFIIRKRQELFLKVHAITSEGRASSWILGALPPFVIGALYFTTPNYLDPLWNTLPGNIAFAFALALEITGFVVIRKMAEIEV